MRCAIRHAVALLAVCMPLAAQAAIVDIAFDPKGRFIHEAAVPPGKFVELCAKLPRGSAVAWKFDAPAPLDFNVHYHVGDKVEFPAKRDAVMALKGDLIAPSDQHYCWMWRNKGDSSVPLAAELRRR